MPILTPTAATGATSKPTAMTYVDPAREQTDADSQTFLRDAGFNGPFVADLLSSMLAHERAGRHLYRSVAGRTANAALERKYTEFGAETEEHVRILEELVTTLGGSPTYVSPAARATEHAGSTLLESTYLLGGSLDMVTLELVMLEAVFLAEAKDHANWESLAKLADALGDGAAKDAMKGAVEHVESQEDEHLEWAKETRGKLLAIQAQSPEAPPSDAPADEQLAYVQQML